MSDSDESSTELRQPQNAPGVPPRIASRLRKKRIVMSIGAGFLGLAVGAKLLARTIQNGPVALTLILLIGAVGFWSAWKEFGG